MKNKKEKKFALYDRKIGIYIYNTIKKEYYYRKKVQNFSPKIENNVKNRRKLMGCIIKLRKTGDCNTKVKFVTIT